ncbi:helix-turn-helix domain-containing protein [Flavobacterium daemonense]|uniref:helix-turn-helix domain-containing protein n=1 Tax=Flavobacterium daemonense TaxID=1393049 RepID=UPI00118654A7|nr:helix-turn-helix transcriptional regulator [Flavobacterium daemonense]KAF2336192.1 helix-turn-helix transcriptional regulator [Flavobacterium daemonense]
MERKNNNPAKISSISQFHDLLRLPKPLHPMVSLIDNTQLVINEDIANISFLLDFYKISYKFSTKGKMGYGQGYYDFTEGGLMFASPSQLIFTENEEGVEYGGYTLLFHPDFIRNYPLGKSIKKYGFFSYDTNEALHLSDSEKTIIIGLLTSIDNELHTAIDEMSQDVIVSYIDVLVNYSNRFYKRQFITRKTISNDLLLQVEETLENYLNDAETLKRGLPTVEFLASQIKVSSHYLSDMLRNLTGQNAQQHIHSKLIEKSKDFLITTNLSVAEIAYQLGFEYPQSFSKLFKKKTSLTPLEFKNSLN